MRVIAIFIVLLLSSFSHAGTIVRDSTKGELIKLKKSVEAIYGLSCQEPIIQTGNSFSIDLKSCFPVQISSLLGKRAILGGPNCYNFAFYSLGLMDSLRTINEEELLSHFFDGGSLCQKNATIKNQPGEIVSIENKNTYGVTRKLHAYVVLTEKYVLTKNGPDTKTKWEISTKEDVSAIYNGNTLVSYTCNPVHGQVPQNTKRYVDAIQNYSSFINSQQVKSSVKTVSYEILTDRTNLMLNMLFEDPLAIERLVQVSENDIQVERVLYEYVSHFISLKEYLHYLLDDSESGIIDPIKKAQSETFIVLLDRYVDVFNKILTVSESKHYGMARAFYAEGFFEYDYCYDRYNPEDKLVCIDL